MRTTIEKAQMLLNAAINAAKARDKVGGTHRAFSHVEAIELHTQGDGESAYADRSATSQPIVAVGDWNNVDTYDRLAQTRVVVSDIPRRLAKALEKLGIPCEWSDEWTTCCGCGRLIRTQPDSYAYEPQYVLHNGEITCVKCTDHAAEGCA